MSMNRGARPAKSRRIFGLVMSSSLLLALLLTSAIGGETPSSATCKDPSIGDSGGASKGARYLDASGCCFFAPLSGCANDGCRPVF